MEFFNLKYQFLINKYKRWRKLGMKLNHSIEKEIPQDVLLEAAGEFHMLTKDGIIIFDSKDETAYLMDRIIYDIERDSKRYIEYYLEKYKDSLSDMQKRLLEAMQNSVYSLFIIRDVKAGVGAHITDAFSNERLFLCDINMSQTVQKGCLISCRIISIDNIHFTSGCACIFKGIHLKLLRDNFINLFEKKKNILTWQQMMRKYNPYFFKIMRQTGMKLRFC